ILDYKVQKIRTLMQNDSDTYLFFGDNTESDIQVYEQISKAFPDRVLGFFIHAIRKPLLSETLSARGSYYYTAFDLATFLKQNGTLSLSAWENTGMAILKETDEDNILPEFQKCPDTYSVSGTSDENESLIQAVEARVQKICKLGLLPL